MEHSKDNTFIYAVKFIACLFVITIHARIPGVFGDMVFCISKFAVPFFFAISGRFLLTMGADKVAGDTIEVRSCTFKRLKKLLKIIAIVWPSYLLFSLCYFMARGDTIGHWLTDKFNAFESRAFFMFNSGRYIYDESYVFDHLWYLFALLYVYILIIIFAPVLRKWYKGLIVILLFFLFFGELLQTIYPIRPFDISISTWYVMRNWLFVGMPFVLIGVLFSDHILGLKKSIGEEAYVNRSKSFFIPALIGVIAGCVISYVEMLIMGGKDVYIGSLIIVVSLLFMSECGIEAPEKLTFLGKESSSTIYFYHVMIIAVMDHLSQNGIIPDYSMMLKPFLVMIICTLLFGFIPWMFKKVKTNE